SPRSGRVLDSERTTPTSSLGARAQLGMSERIAWATDWGAIPDPGPRGAPFHESATLCRRGFRLGVTFAPAGCEGCNRGSQVRVSVVEAMRTLAPRVVWPGGSVLLSAAASLLVIVRPLRRGPRRSLCVCDHLLVRTSCDPTRGLTGSITCRSRDRGAGAF